MFRFNIEFMGDQYNMTADGSVALSTTRGANILSLTLPSKVKSKFTVS